MTEVITRRFRYLRLSIGLHFVHDGSAVICWNSPSAGSYNFLSLPGGGAVAGSYSLNGTTTTWVPLLDTSGSTIGLVNAAATGSPPSTTYTYSPSGNPTASGTANDWPFQYQGMEKEFNDPAPYYYSGGGQFYSPLLVRSLSETSQTSSSGTGGPSPTQLPYGPGSQGNGSFGQWYLAQLDPHFGQFDPAALPDITVGTSEGASYVIPVGAIAEAIEELVSFFEWLFGGSGAPPTPRQLLHGRHPLYGAILGIQLGLLPDESSAGAPDVPKPCPPVPGPPGILKRNIDLARKHGINPFYLLSRVCRGCIWDYNRKWGYTPEHDDFGNFNAGAVAAAAGYPRQVILRAAGAEHQCAGTISGNERGNPFGSLPYGNNEHSEAEVAEGIDYVEMGCD
jgi:hypothetical protein